MPPERWIICISNPSLLASDHPQALLPHIFSEKNFKPNYKLHTMLHSKVGHFSVSWCFRKRCMKLKKYRNAELQQQLLSTTVLEDFFFLLRKITKSNPLVKEEKDIKTYPPQPSTSNYGYFFTNR